MKVKIRKSTVKLKLKEYYASLPHPHRLELGFLGILFLLVKIFWMPHPTPPKTFKNDATCLLYRGGFQHGWYLTQFITETSCEVSQAHCLDECLIFTDFLYLFSTTMNKKKSYQIIPRFESVPNYLKIYRYLIRQLSNLFVCPRCFDLTSEYV